MTELSFHESYRTHGFALEVGGTRCPVTKVSGLSEGTTDVIEQPDGGSPVVRKIASGVVKFEELVIERNMDGSPFDLFFRQWFMDMFQLTGPSGGSSVRRNGAVLKLENGVEVLRFGFVEGWVSSSSFSDLEAGSTNLWKQTVTIQHNGLFQLL